MKGETKQARFKRVAEKRVQRVLDSLRSLSQCSNKRMYEWDDGQLKKDMECGREGLIARNHGSIMPNRRNSASKP